MTAVVAQRKVAIYVLHVVKYFCTRDVQNISDEFEKFKNL